MDELGDFGQATLAGQDVGRPIGRGGRRQMGLGGVEVVEDLGAGDRPVDGPVLTIVVGMAEPVELLLMGVRMPIAQGPGGDRGSLGDQEDDDRPEMFALVRG